MKCQKCGAEISEQDAYELKGAKLCEDCYIEIVNPLQICDPFAVRAAEKTREMLGQSGTEGLNEIQKSIYEFIKERGKVTTEEIARQFNLTPYEVQRQFAVLRWCGLIRGCIEGNRLYLTLM